MAFPLAQAARALANDYRTQASQIQSIDVNGCITNLGLVDITNFRMSFPRALIPQHEEVLRALWDAKSALSATLADVVDLWAADIERINLDELASNARETRNTRRAHPY